MSEGYMDIEFNIQSILMDFEVGAMKAANKVWKIDTKGCYFHFTQDGWRFVQNSGMASSYLSSKDDEFRLEIDYSKSSINGEYGDKMDLADNS